MTTPTPRTDAFLAEHPDGFGMAPFARQLERDLAAAQENLQSADEDRLRMRAQTARLDAALIEKDISIAAREAELAAMKQAKERAEYLLGCESRYLAASRDALKAAQEALKAAEVARDEWIDTAMAALDRAQRAEQRAEAAERRASGDAELCCGEFESCNRRCVPLVEHWKRKAEEAERDAGRYRWLIKQVSHDEFIPIAQVVWKQFSNPHGEWVNLINGADLDAHIDSHLPAIAAKGEA